MSWFKKELPQAKCVDPKLEQAYVTVGKLATILDRLEIIRKKLGLCSEWFECDGKHETSNISSSCTALVQCSHCHSLIPYNKLKFIAENYGYSHNVYCSVCGSRHIKIYHGTDEVVPNKKGK